ncbi:MAG: response regulator [Bacteroidales bacterium]|nr:response regulator [Bacteroidales bacterium]
MKSSRIFIVDKNPIHRNLIRYNLESNKFTNVHVFPSGEECLYRMEHKIYPDLLIASFFTGNSTGFDFLRSILEISPFTLVIYFDKFEDPQLPQRLIEAGAHDFVGKTTDPDAGISALLKNINYLLRETALVNLQ